MGWPQNRHVAGLRHCIRRRQTLAGGFIGSSLPERDDATPESNLGGVSEVDIPSTETPTTPPERSDDAGDMHSESELQRIDDLNLGKQFLECDK